MEGTWRLFQRRLTQFQSWQTGTRRLVRWSETKRTIVFSRTKLEGQDWRRSRKIFKNRPLQRKGATFRAVTCFQNSSCRFWHPPVCHNTSLRPDAYVAKNADSDMLRLRRSPAKKQRKVVRKDQLHYRRSLQNWVVCLKILIRENLFYVKKEDWDQNTPSNSPRAPGAQIKIRERKGPLRGIIPKCEPHERSPCSPTFGERSHEETLHQERCARKVALDSAKLFHKLKNADKPACYSSIEARRMLALTSKSPEEQEFVVDSGASMHMLSKKVLSSDELDTLGRSRDSTVVVTANGEAQTNEEAQEKVHDLDLFVTVQLHEETPAVPSLPKKGRQLYAKRTISVTLVVPGLSTNSESVSSSTSTLQDLSPTNPAQERRVQASGNWSASLPKSPIKKRKRDARFGRPFARSSWMVGGVHRWFRGHRSACTRTHFSGLRVGTSHEMGIKIKEAPDFLLTSRMRLAWYKQKTWKKHQSTVYWVDIKLAQKKGLKFYQTRSNGTIFYDTLRACCIPKAIMMGTGEIIYEKVDASSRLPSVSNQLGRFSRETIIWFKDSPQYRNLDTIDGEPKEFEWNIFPRFTTLQLINRVQEFIKQIGRPSAIPRTNYLHVDVQWHHMVH